jgi:hypothetical protein
VTTIFELVEDALSTLSPAVPFALHPYQSLDTLPDTYITYQLPDSTAEQHADNIETERSYLVQIDVWDVNGLVSLPNVDTAMTTAGFQKSRRRQLPRDALTGHFGLALDYVYLEGQ